MLLAEQTNIIGTKTMDCFHCGTPCVGAEFLCERRHFCCNGCMTVYQLITDSGFDTYYKLAKTPGSAPLLGLSDQDGFEVLDTEEVFTDMIKFQDENNAVVALDIPNIHCVSCVWLLENIHRLFSGIGRSQVNFEAKTVTINFNKNEIKLSELCRKLTQLGYQPTLSMNVGKLKINDNRSLILKIAVAGFCFGNIMLFSFPLYLGLDPTTEAGFYHFFRYLNAILAIPVLTYCSSNYWRSGKNFISKHIITLDLPIFIGILAIGIQSYIDVFLYGKEGYFDSLAGLLFFLLTGRYFQEKIQSNLSFERDYKSFFPLWARKIMPDGSFKSTLIRELQKGDKLQLKNGELIPCDAVLLSLKAKIDYSFVTGEETPVEVNHGQILYAGGRQLGTNIEICVTRPCSTSYLTSLWQRINNTLISKKFTITIFTIASLTALFWSFTSMELAIKTFTAVLIVACPCALALALPYTLGFTTRFLNRKNLFIKQSSVIEALAACDTIVFDKTGTLTSSNGQSVTLSEKLTTDEQQILYSICRHSSHPISEQICKNLPESKLSITDFSEIPGKGLSGFYKGQKILLGNEKLITHITGKGTFFAIEGKVISAINVTPQFRHGLNETLNELASKFPLHLLSGDNEKDLQAVKDLNSNWSSLTFNCSPADKMDYIEKLEKNHHKTLMIGDGLNDSGALKQATAGIAITENVSHFFPACSGILHASNLKDLNSILNYCRLAIKMVRFNFMVSSLYNLIGLSFAVTGFLSPIVCAVLMPISSLTIFLLSATGTWLGYKHHFKESKT
jgi:P-type Cu+ transporter